MTLTERHRKLLKAATLYYQKGMTQEAIGKAIGVSRPVVAKYLQQARDEGIVEIFIKDEHAHLAELSIALSNKYELEDVIVVGFDDVMQGSIRKQVGRAAARYLTENMNTLQSIGLTWGTTLAEMVAAMPFLEYPQSKVIPLVGGVSGEHLYYDTNHLAFRLAEKLGGLCQYFYAPAMAESEAFAGVLNQTQLVTDALQAASAVDLALVGVGNPLNSSTWIKLGYLTQNQLEDFTKEGVIGDCSASMFDQRGRTVDNEVSRRLIGIKVENLKKMKQVMFVASGEDKIDSLHALLKGKTGSLLVADELLAKGLLAKE